MQYHTSNNVFIGYFENHKGYMYLHPSGRIYISNSMKFNKHKFPFLTGFMSTATCKKGTCQKDDIFSSVPIRVFNEAFSMSSGNIPTQGECFREEKSLSFKS